MAKTKGAGTRPAHAQGSSRESGSKRAAGDGGKSQVVSSKVTTKLGTNAIQKQLNRISLLNERAGAKSGDAKTMLAASMMAAVATGARREKGGSTNPVRIIRVFDRTGIAKGHNKLAAAAEVFKANKHMWVSYLAANVAGKSKYGALRAMYEVTKTSFKSGLNGRVALHSAHSPNTVKFYDSIGFGNKGQGGERTLTSRAAKSFMRSAERKLGLDAFRF